MPTPKSTMADVNPSKVLADYLVAPLNDGALSILVFDENATLVVAEGTALASFSAEADPIGRTAHNLFSSEPRIAQAVDQALKGEPATLRVQAGTVDWLVHVQCPPADSSAPSVLTYWLELGLLPTDDLEALRYTMPRITERAQIENILHYHLEFERLVTTVSTRFIDLDFEAIDDGVRDALSLVGSFTRAEQAFLFRFSPDGSAVQSHAWCETEVLDDDAQLNRYPTEAVQTFGEELNTNGFIHISDIEDPAEGGEKYAAFKQRGYRSFLCIPVRYAGQAIGFLGIATIRRTAGWSQDTTALLKIIGEILANALERKRSEAALRASEERYKLAALGANDGLWDWDLTTNRIYFSTRWKTLLGFSEEDIGDNPDEWIQRIHEEDRPLFLVELDAHMTGQTRHFEYEQRVLHKDGTYRWMLSRGLAVRDEQGRTVRLAGSQTDVTARKVAESQLVHNAFHDHLTELANRALFLDRLDRLLKQAKRRRDPGFAVLFMDMDRFKVVNDGLGHNVGDQLLISVARRLETCLRPGDTVARLAGDEFTVILDDMPDKKNAIQVAERMRAEICRPFVLSGNEVFTSASIGIAYYQNHYEEPEDMLRDADMAMYKAKTAGLPFAIFDDGMHTEAIERVQLESDLRRGLANREFHLLYQPILSLATEEVIGFEALARWEHPEKGLISPGVFIPIVEENGLIQFLGKWALLEACQQMAIWQAQFSRREPLKLNVNLSPRQLTQSDLATHIRSIIEETGVLPGTLRLELTESVLMHHAEDISALMKDLRSMDCKLHIDDFGTGYSSLSYLHRFPFDGLKIDRSFIDSLETDAQSREIVRSIIMLAHELKLPVTAEGIETEGQLKYLQELGCDYGQGFYFHRPLAGDMAASLLAQKVPSAR